MEEKNQRFIQTMQPNQRAWIAEQVAAQQKQMAAPDRSCITRDPVKYRRAHITMGTMQIVIGVLFMIFAPILGVRTALGKMAISFGMSGLWFILAGSFGIGGRNKRKCMLITCLVFCIFAAITSACVMAGCGSGLRAIKYGRRHDVDHDRDYNDWENKHKHHGRRPGPPDSVAPPPSPFDKKPERFADSEPEHQYKRCHKGYIVMFCTLTFLAMVEFVVSIVHAVYCCKATCCGSASRVTQAPIIVYMQGTPPGVDNYNTFQATAPAPNVYPIMAPIQPPAYAETEEEKKPIENAIEVV